MKTFRPFLLAAAFMFGASVTQAQPTAVPPNIVAANNLPMVMLSTSKDFTMFWKAYTDFDDIDFDGAVDMTFKPDFVYYGYFDSKKCYTYVSDNKRFEPTREIALGTKELALDEVTTSYTGYYCGNSGEWSGNFLNWISMSRMDILRKVLYGGKRSQDDVDGTTLELSFVPRNSQAFVKYYNRPDIVFLTPFTIGSKAASQGVTFCRRPDENTGSSHDKKAPPTPVIRTAVGNVILWNMTEVRTCNWSGEIDYGWKPETIAYLAANYETPAGTLAAGDQHGHLASVPTNGGFDGANTSYVARVQVCVDKLRSTEKCKPYGTTPVYKPSGLLQDFGESINNGVEPARAEFGLMLGSYDHNLDAGVLRKNMGQINDEIDADTGVFKAPSGSGGIIDSLNKLTLFDYNLATGNYETGSCSTTYRYSDVLPDGQCPSWGNPVGELLLESLRYYAGKKDAPTWASSTLTRDHDKVGLPVAPAWTDPLLDNPDIGETDGPKATRSQLYGKPICRPLNMLTITSGSNSFDDDLRKKSLLDINASENAVTLTNLIGTHEGGINGSKRLIGESGTSADGLCTGKDVAGLGDIKGICADGPNFRGTYLGAGIAYHANTNAIRPDSDFGSLPADVPANKLTVRNYGVSMSGGVATIEVPTDDGKKVYITPAGKDTVNGRPLPGNMVDFKILRRSADGKSGAALVLWQHSMLGEDQDQDMLAALRWEVDDATTPWKLRVYTQAIESNTGSTAKYAFGYTLVGTENVDDGNSSDGVHFHSGINLADTTEASGSVLLSTGAIQGAHATDIGGGVCAATSGSNGKLCSVVNGKTTRGETYKIYRMVGKTDVLLKEPLWFISKYGGFKYYPGDEAKPKYQDNPPTMENREPWDVKRADGEECGGTTGRSCNDGEPDNYFVARRPDLLEKSLTEILEDVVNSSNTSPAIASSQLRASDLKYVASFDPNDGRGELAAYAIDSETGLFVTDSTWKAHQKLTDPSANSRPVITNNGTNGVPFQWDDLNTDKQNVLKSGEDKKFGEAMMAWLRGNTENKSDFRLRATSSVLGPVVNSNPTVQIPPNGNYFGNAFSGYSTFVQTWKSRRTILWVGAGDGMLHGFDASSSETRGGTPVMSYIPEPLFSRLPEWASPSKPKVQAFVDGSPFVGDVKISNSWATYLFSSLGRGGKAIFALDVTKAGTVDINDNVSGSELDEGHASSIFRWQFTSADDADLGYVVSEPTTSRFSNQAGQIARMNNGKFAVLFGNGVMSETGNAALYILFVDGPSAGSWSGRYVKIVAQTKADGGPENGLSQPVWVDENNDSIADVIYAGDIQGNLWKFDVSSADESDWALAYSDHPLFIATDEDDATKRLPITGAPEYRFHPMGGLLVSIATGKSIASGDFPSSGRTDAMFGIWDKPSYAEVAPDDLDETLPRGYGKLTAREFVSIDDQTSLLVTGAAMNWDEAQGWNLPFKETSEMSVSNMSVANGQLMAVTVRPQLDSDLCNAGPLARLIAVDAMTGLPASGLLGTITIDGVEYSIGAIDINDQKVRISNDSVGTGSNHDNESCAKGAQNCIRIVGEETDKGLSSANNRARIYWREIPGLKTRVIE